MSKPKMRVTGIRTDKDKDGKPILIKVLSLDTSPAPCSNCKSEPRREGSSSCKKCADEFHASQFESNRLKKKIEDARKK